MGMKLTTHLDLVPKLRVHGAIPPLPYNFMVWFLIENRDKITAFWNALGAETLVRIVTVSN
jgi:hypothetical protein